MMRTRNVFGPGCRLVGLGGLTAAAVLVYFHLLSELPVLPNSGRLPHKTIPSPEECPCPRDLQEARGVKGVVMEMVTNEAAVIGFLQLKKLPAQRGVGSLRHPLDPVFEMPLFEYPPLKHSLCLPDHRRSKVHLLTPADQVSVGSPVQFRIDLYNGCGQPRFTGGDEIRAWLKSQDGNSSVAARVKDLHNGSYVGETILPWPGVTLVRVSLTYAQEFLRASVEMYHTLHAMRWTAEVLTDGTLKEAVPCLPYPSIPGYAKACNFTAANGDLPWFCGHPLTKGLNCSHRSQYKELSLLEPLPVPEPLRQYVKRLTHCCHLGKFNHLRLITNDVTLVTSQVDQADVKQPKDRGQFPGTLPPCSSRHVSGSWQSPSSPYPRGWIIQGQWNPSSCTLPPVTEDRVQRCMRNRTLLLLGDSNQRILFNLIQNMTGCTTSTMRNQTAWNAPMICKNATLRSSTVYATHAFPFMPVHTVGVPLANLPLPQALNFVEQQGYQGNGDVTVVLHYYMHLSPHPVQVYRNFVQDARRRVREYLKLHPKAKFLIRGPHVLYDGNQHHVHIGDKFARWYQRIWHQEFADLRDRVWYLDMWDLSIASENEEMHMIPMLRQILRIVFGYMCDEV